MFGYVRPVRDTLSEEEYGDYRALYCGLCHTMGRRCGAFARFAVNYDFTFLAMLLSRAKGKSACDRRCWAHPFKKRPCLGNDPALETAADYSVILARWKLLDTAYDESFVKALFSRIAAFFLGPNFRRAAKRAPEFAALVKQNLTELRALEKENCPSVDRTADRFAKILAAASVGEPDGKRRRVLEQLFYHTGRLVYLMDATDDLPEDFQKKRYNPLIHRYGLDGPSLAGEQAAELERTQRHSINLIASAFQLLDPGPWTGILTNIVYLGLPAMGAKLLQARVPGANTENGDTI